MNLRSITKLIGVACIMLFIVPHIVIASEGTQNVTEFRFTARFTETDLSFDELMGYDVVRLKDASTINEIGKPVMPAKDIKVALPRGMEATSVQVVATQKVDIEGEYTIFPAQPPIRISDKPEGFVQPNLDIYNSMEPYPSELVEFIDQTDLAGQGMAVIQINPVRYIPGEKKLILYTMISVIIEGKGGYICGDYLPQNISEHNRNKYEQMIKDMVINPEDVQLNTTGGTGSLDLPEGGPYGHVIISRSADTTYWKPLAEWRTKCGLKSIVVTTTWIYDNYGGADHQEEIRNFIMDARSTWGTMYFLLCGENSDLPFEYRTYEGDNIPSDQYYGDYDGDWTYEVYVGRSTARGSTEIDRFIDKVLKYEQDPPLTNYILDVTLLGMDLTRAQDPPYYTLTRGEYLKMRIDSWYIPGRFAVTEVYDTESENHRTEFLNALNDGQGLVNHNDHANATVMCTGDRNHNGSHIDRGDVDALTNTNRMSVIYSLGCHCNEMDYSWGDCIAEHFVIHNSLQAGVAYTGNTRSGWFYVGDPYSLSCQLDQYWWEGLFDYDKYILGEALAYTKDECPYGSSVWKYCQWTLNLLGEPAMPIWTDTPESFDVTHDATVPIGFETYDVHVEEDGGGNVYEAYVCLWIPDEDIYATGYTNTSGNVTLTLDPYPTEVGNDVYVTITKHNYLPYEDTATTNIAGYWLDLSKFPMYEAALPESSGAAVAMMTVNYMHWDTLAPPESALIVYDQTELYNYGITYSGASPYFDMQAVWHCVQDGPYRPLPYSEYGYNFTKRHDNDRDQMLIEICYWIDYPAGRYLNHPVHVPALVPTYGNYTNWVAVRGINTADSVYGGGFPDEITIYGFWINDPIPGGIGENSYKNINTWNSTYYDSMTTGDYVDEWLGIFEPPPSTEGCELIIPPPIPRFTPAQMELLGDVDGQTILQEDENQWIIDAAIAGVTEELIPYDENFADVFENTIPGLPMYATSFNNDNYYLVPFNAGKVKKVRNKSVPADAKTTVVILINAQDGSFKEASWTEDVVKYLPLSKTEARQIAFDAAEDYGLEVEEINDLKPELIHRQSSPYYPEWLVIIGEYGIFISQDGTVSIEEYSGLGSGPGGPMSQDEGTSFTYGLNTALPTPFIKSTMISYSIARPGHVSLDIYDVCGRLVKTLVNAHMDAGVYNLQWNGYDNNNQKLAPGVYFTRLASGEFTSVKKTILAR